VSARPLAALLLGALALLGLRAAIAPEAPAAAGQEPRAERTAPVAVVLVRHAEKADEPADDPGLSAAGRDRARALARLCAPAGVTHLYASEFRRTQETLAPLSERTGVAVETRSARDPGALARELAALPGGSVAVVAGHSNTVPALVEALGGTARGAERGPTGAVLREEQYDRLFVVTLPAGGGPAATLALAYGAGGE
jgi:phosphohistidine phosphatase SixA